jgi:hypothetical protein
LTIPFYNNFYKIKNLFVSKKEKGDIMKKFMYFLLLVLLSISVVATGMMDFTGGYGITHKSGKGCFLGLIYFIVGSFIFSAVFWLTHKWIMKSKKK